jgi:hypothetical protein
VERFGRHGSDRSLRAASRFRLWLVSHGCVLCEYARSGEEAGDALERRVYI